MEAIMKIVHKLWLALLEAAIVAAVAGTSAVAQQSQKPNVVFILADNVGYGDLGSYGGRELRGAPTCPATTSRRSARGSEVGATTRAVAKSAKISLAARSCLGHE